jgi:hypothetical protein
MQRDFLCRILDRHPNIVATMGELRDVRMRSDQFGAIHHIREPIKGLACSSCDYAAPNDMSDRMLRGHWLAHGPPLAASKGKKTWKPLDSYIPCQVQSMNHDTIYALWLAIPSNTSKETGDHPAPFQGFGSLLAGKLCADRQAPLKFNRSLILPFFHQSGAADFIEPFDPEFLVDLIALPSKNEPTLLRLKCAVVERFQKLCSTIIKAPLVVRKLLVTPNAWVLSW